MFKSRFSIVILLLIFSLPLLCQASADKQHIQDYKFFTGKLLSPSSHSPLVILRKFLMDGRVHYLAVEPSSLMTSIQEAKGLKVDEYSWEMIRAAYKNSAYIRAIEDAESKSLPLQDAGLTHFFTDQAGVNLTVDLCPSQNPLDRRLFSELIKSFEQIEKPLPVAVALTGLWMEKHEEDLEWLKELQKQKAIDFTWVNHSYHHRTSKDSPLKENFLLQKGTDINLEVLKTEAAMIERGLTPSVFFRFPGLVSDEKLFHIITSFGLIPVGSDAWLAKNQWPKNGSIILVHATGNETIGIQRFLKLIQEEQKKISNKHWLLLDLRESTVKMEKDKK
jgi:hypothetical protein